MSFVRASFRLGMPWATFDPFLFCVHHDDAYPAGNGAFGPAASLAGRDLGQDFSGREGWSMYHGRSVPGFPQHPHRGFETVTVVRRGLIDHSDSLGAAARYGQGDAQWLTAGGGVVHSEMFPLLETSGPNPLDLFQIWLNLPPADKLAPPHFSMLWADRIPVVEGDGWRATVIAGELEGRRPPPPPPRSWAAAPDHHVAIWTLTLAPGASFTLPPVAPGVDRTLYVARGGLSLDAPLPARTGARLVAERAVPLRNGPAPSELLLLQGRPIGAPVAHYGPFVMNDEDGLRQAFLDYRRTGFGGWPWPDDAPVHGPDPGRFARQPDGRIERPGDQSSTQP